MDDRALFDTWAATYDQSIDADGDEFPFAGYERVLDEVLRLADPAPTTTVLDLGVGTGNLVLRFTGLGCEVWGVDASARMLDEARRKLPQAVLIQADLTGEWPPALQRRFDRIVSAYTFHHFDLETQVDLLRRLTTRNLARGGRIVVADVAFPTGDDRERARAEWIDYWDEDETYFAADQMLAACCTAGLRAAYSQVTWCGGVLVVEPAAWQAGKPAPQRFEGPGGVLE